MAENPENNEDGKPGEESALDESPRVESETEAIDAVVVEGEASPPRTDRTEDDVPAQLGMQKYVHAAFFAAGILVAYISSHVLAGIWNALAGIPAVTRVLPLLIRYGEDERPSFTTAIGAAIGLLLVVQTYRKESIRQWADEVSGELAKVHWPDREAVTNGTIVVMIAGAIATVYVALLDRFWGFVTTLVYGA